MQPYSGWHSGCTCHCMYVDCGSASCESRSRQPLQGLTKNYIVDVWNMRHMYIGRICSLLWACEVFFELGDSHMRSFWWYRLKFLQHPLSASSLGCILMRLDSDLCILLLEPLRHWHTLVYAHTLDSVSGVSEMHGGQWQSDNDSAIPYQFT